jgi:very-short-patch-repair endonuclease
MKTPKPRLKYELARRFRRELTPPEARLWLRLKGRPEDVHFRKQHPVGPYIVDFYCAAARLVVEVDRQIHNVPEVQARDDIRTKWLTQQGLEVVRITGADIMDDPDEAALGIILRAKEILARNSR